MTKEIEIAGRKIMCAELTFGTVRKLRNMGVDFSNLNTDLFDLANAYLRVSTGMSEDVVDVMLQKHIVGGGTLEPIVDAFGQAMEESDFFQALAKTEETATE